MRNVTKMPTTSAAVLLAVATLLLSAISVLAQAGQAVASHASSLLAGAVSARQSAESPAVSFKRMPDGKQWTTDNLNVDIPSSYCYDDAETNCRRYGRLYTWSAAQRGCKSLGDGWRLPTNDEWRQFAKHYGGVRDDSDDTGQAAFKALMIGGSSAFNAVLGGGRSDAGEYSRLEAHGFYWTASESDSATAWFYNFGRGGQALNRHRDGEKLRAFSVRCVRD